MNLRVIGLIGVAVIGSALSVPEAAYAFGGTLTVTYNSVNCTDLVTGGTKQTANDGSMTCVINIQEIGTKCVNKKGNADSSSSHIFAVNHHQIQKPLPGSQWVFQKNGNATAEIVFDLDSIAAALGSDFPTLDAATLCPNRNWQLKWAVTRLDLVAVVSTVANNYVPYFPDTVQAFSSCNPNPTISPANPGSGLTYTTLMTDTSGNLVPDPSTADPTKGIIGECLLLRDNLITSPSGPFDGQDHGGLALTDPNFTPKSYYHGICSDHGKENGNITNKGDYNKWGPSVDDPECTGFDTLMDGVY